MPKKRRRREPERKFSVKFRDDVSEERIREINRSLGTEIASFDEEEQIYIVRATGRKSVEQLLDEYNALPEVEYAEPMPKRTLKPRKRG